MLADMSLGIFRPSRKSTLFCSGTSSHALVGPELENVIPHITSETGCIWAGSASTDDVPSPRWCLLIARRPCLSQLSPLSGASRPSDMRTDAPYRRPHETCCCWASSHHRRRALLILLAVIESTSKASDVVAYGFSSFDCCFCSLWI